MTAKRPVDDSDLCWATRPKTLGDVHWTAICDARATTSIGLCDHCHQTLTSPKEPSMPTFEHTGTANSPPVNYQLEGHGAPTVAGRVFAPKERVAAAVNPDPALFVEIDAHAPVV